MGEASFNASLTLLRSVSRLDASAFKFFSSASSPSLDKSGVGVAVGGGMVGVGASVGSGAGLFEFSIIKYTIPTTITITTKPPKAIKSILDEPLCSSGAPAEGISFIGVGDSGTGFSTGGAAGIAETGAASGTGLAGF